MSQFWGWSQEAQSQRKVVSPTTLTLLQFLGREYDSHGGGIGSCGGTHLAAPLLRALSKNPFKRLWFGANPSPALISVAQLGCYGDWAHHAKLGERW